jgi:hypothetical protein
VFEWRLLEALIHLSFLLLALLALQANVLKDAVQEWLLLL